MEKIVKKLIISQIITLQSIEAFSILSDLQS
jgi:hypothetical protein